MIGLKKVLICGILILTVVIVSSFSFSSCDSNSTLQSVPRTVSYNEKAFNDESLFEDFDDHKITDTDDGFKVAATKSFDKSIFEELDLVGLDNDSDDVTINYEASYIEEESTIYLSIYFSDNDGNNSLIEVLPGLITFNKNGETDLMFLDGEEEIWLSDLQESDIINNTGFWNFVKKVIDNVVESEPAKAIIKAVSVVFAPFIRLATTTLYLSPKASSFAAWVGAKALNMNEETKVTKYSDGTESVVRTGIYHADFNCWQQNLGYDDLYDDVFDNGTQISGKKRMERHKYEIDIDGDNISDYILWAWKGDYYNLGAGCELGIYKKIQTTNFGLRWTVDKGNAFSCNVNLKYKGVKDDLIDWNNNGDKHWWFTGFNSKFQYPKLSSIDDLTATFNMTFNCFDSQYKNDKMYNDFNSQYKLYKNYYSKDWKYWSVNNNVIYYNRMRCHTATLSF